MREKRSRFTVERSDGFTASKDLAEITPSDEKHRLQKERYNTM